MYMVINMTGKEAKERLEKQYRRQNNFVKNNYDRISVTVPKGTRARIKATGETANGIISRLLLAWLDEQEQTEPEPDPIRTKPEEPERIDTLPEDAWQLPFM